MVSLLQQHVLSIIIVLVFASFILPLTRSLSDDPGFACPGWRSELLYYQIVPWSHIGDSSSRLFIGILVIYFCYLIYPCFYICYFAWYMLLFLWWHTTHVLHCIYSVFICLPACSYCICPPIWSLLSRHH